MTIKNRTWKAALKSWHKKMEALRPPDKLIKEMARCLLTDIIDYCESEKGKADFLKWQETTKGKAS